MATKFNYTQIRAEADLYKYSIVPSIDSWNLTVALKNYLWQDPSITTPVKVQIWDTVRTITSACSTAEPSWWNVFNAWSSELATKEIDYFVYLQQKTWEPTYIWFSRIPNAITSNDFNPDFLNEKYSELGYDNNWQNAPVVNIWRFSAILSAGAWYTWSTPSAWFQVINHYINETKLLDYNWYYYTTWTTGTVDVTYNNKYKIVWSEVHLFIRNTINSISWSNWGVNFRLPFYVNNNIPSEMPISWFICKYGENPITQWKWQPILTDNRLSFLNWVDAWVYSGDLLTNERIRIQWFYQI